MTELTHLTLASARDRLAKREISARELTDAFLDAIAAANPALNAYVTVTADQARAMARISDNRLANGTARPLEGIPLGIKDLFATKGVHTQACSHVLDGFKPPYESTVTQNLWDNGAVMLGKLNMDEFAMGSSNETSCFGPVVNPWRRRRNGALDNASGVAAILEIAETFAKAPKPPRRSVMFASVTLEEQGLLGSEFLAKYPPVPLNKIVAGLNFDGVGPRGPAKDMNVVGSGASQIEDILAAELKKQDRTPSPDPEPEKGSFYRSDHISLAKVGVPMLYAGGGVDLREGGRAAGMALRDDYRANRYHQPSDEFKADWDLRGAVEDITALYGVGADIANSDAWPTWVKGNEFKAIREKSMRAK